MGRVNGRAGVDLPDRFRRDVGEWDAGSRARQGRPHRRIVAACETNSQLWRCQPSERAFSYGEVIATPSGSGPAGLHWGIWVRVLLSLSTVIILLPSCGPEGGDGEDLDCEIGAPGCEPELSACFQKQGHDDTSTCAQLCQGVGAACAAEACDGATHMTFMGCDDQIHEGGISAESACDAPVAWGLADAVQCCCTGGEE